MSYELSIIKAYSKLSDLSRPIKAIRPKQTYQSYQSYQSYKSYQSYQAYQSYQSYGFNAFSVDPAYSYLSILSILGFLKADRVDFSINRGARGGGSSRSAVFRSARGAWRAARVAFSIGCRPPKISKTPFLADRGSPNSKRKLLKFWICTF